MAAKLGVKSESGKQAERFKWNCNAGKSKFYHKKLVIYQDINV
jgi:hypothetical protein